MVVEQTAVAERTRAGAGQVAYAFHDHRDRSGSEQGLAQVAGVEGNEARGEIGQGIKRRRQARIVDDQPLKVSRQACTAAQVVGDH